MSYRSYRPKVKTSVKTLWQVSEGANHVRIVERTVSSVEPGGDKPQVTYRTEYKSAKQDEWETLSYSGWSTLHAAWQSIYDYGSRERARGTFWGGLAPKALYEAHKAEYESGPDRVHRNAMLVNAVRDVVATLGADVARLVMDAGHYEHGYLSREDLVLYNLPAITAEDDED